MNLNIPYQRLNVFDKISPEYQNRIKFDESFNTIFFLNNNKKIKFASKLATEKDLLIKANNPEISSENGKAKEFIKKRMDNDINEVDYFFWNDIKIQENITRINIEEIISMMPSKNNRNQSIKELLVLLWLVEFSQDDIVDKKYLTSCCIGDSAGDFRDVNWLGEYFDFWLPVLDIDWQQLSLSIKSFINSNDWNHRYQFFRAELHSNFRYNSFPSIIISEFF